MKHLAKKKNKGRKFKYLLFSVAVATVRYGTIYQKVLVGVN